MRFFFDNNIPPRLVEALRPLDPLHGLEHLRLKFPADVADELWIPTLQDEGDWIVVSGDIAITRNAAQLQLWRESGLTGFFLAKGWVNLELMLQASKFIQVWPKVTELAAKYPTKKTFSIQVGGKVKGISR